MPKRPVIRLLSRLVRLLLPASILALAVLLAAGFVILAPRGELRLWHEPLLSEEFTVEKPVANFAAYLALEERLFAQLERRVLDGIGPEDRSPINRYNRGSLSDPAIWPRNWNRSYVLESANPKAVFLLIHGMSDSPYSLHNLALTLRERGATVIGLRLPGHGTIPAGLLEATWQDMAAAVEIATAAAERLAVGEVPVYVVGYSIGAALAVRHALGRLGEQPGQIKGLFLISPAIGLPRVAGLAALQSNVGRLFGLRKLAWSSIKLEYDPFKYGSFAVNAAYQSYLLTEEIKANLSMTSESGSLDGMPRILAFQSAVDATVSSEAVIANLFQKLPDRGHELVLFDVNRMTDVHAVLANDPKPAMEALLAKTQLTFTLTVLTNAAPDRGDIVLLRRVPGDKDMREVPTDLTWPPGVFSLSHVALPFPASDRLYGDGTSHNSPGIELGVLALRGERGVLRVSADDMLRLRWNPFYVHVEERILDFANLR